MATGRDLHIDAPLTNIAIKAFDGSTANVWQRLFPVVPVGKQSDKYYTISKNSWIRQHDSRRAPRTRANVIEFDVSSDAYYAPNYALAAEIPIEDLSNADQATRILENSTMNLVEALNRDAEIRVANKVTSISNVGSGRTVPTVWSNYTNSDPLSDITTAVAFIRDNTGFLPNVAVCDPNTYDILRKHPQLVDFFKYTEAGLLTKAQLTSVIFPEGEGGELIVARGIKNNALENATASITNIWGNNFLLARVVPGVSLQTATFGLCMRWQPEGMPAFAVQRDDTAEHRAGGKHVSILEAGYYQDEKVVGQQLSYLYTTTI